MSKKITLCIVVLMLFVASVLVGLMGSHTVSYACKSILSVKVLVADQGKYDDAAYEFHYSDGTIGVANRIGSSGTGAAETMNGTVCSTRLQWGFPYQWANQKVKE